jgi:hypothetical protein
MLVLWITIGFALLIAGLAVSFVIWPLIGGPLGAQRTVLVDEAGPLTELLQRKEMLLLSIKELEFDHQTGKLSDEDFQRLDQRLRQQAIGLLRQIERVAPASAALESDLEEAIRRQRKVQAQPAVRTLEEPMMSCPRCQNQVSTGDNFCPKCGLALAPATA